MRALKYIGIALYIPLAFLYYLGALGCISAVINYFYYASPEYKALKMQAAYQDTTPNKPTSQVAVQPSAQHLAPKPTTALQPATSYTPLPFPRGAPDYKVVTYNSVTATPTPAREIIPPKKSNSENRQEVNETEVLSFAQALQLANDGDARAQAIVSIYYGVGYKTQKDTTKAADFAMRSAKQRNGLGIYRVAAMMENGDVFQKDVEQAKKLKGMAFDRLNAGGVDPYALTALGIMLFRGEGGGRQDREQAVTLYKRAAEMGYAPAQYHYSAALARGQGVTKNQEESMRWWRRAFEQDYPPAMSGPVGQASSNANPVQNQTAIQTAPSKPRANQKLPHGIPVAGRPGFVSSPYAPGAGIVDARGAASGDTVICPFTKQPFLLP